MQTNLTYLLRIILISCIYLMPLTIVFGQTGIGDNFNDNTVSCKWNGFGNYSFQETGNELTVNASVAGASYLIYELSFPAINISGNPVLTVRVKSSNAFTLRADLQDASGMNTNATPVTASITNAGTYSIYTFNFAGRFNQSFPSAATVNPNQITKIQFFVNPGGAAFNNSFFMDDLQLGTGGSTDGSNTGCPPPTPSSVTDNIRLNQIGFYTNCPKVAILNGTPSGSNFYVRSLDLATTYFTGTIGAPALWAFSNETVRIADFTNFVTPGQYRVDVPGIGCSYVFTIGTKIHHQAGKAALKAFYHNRGSTATTAAYAGVYARAGGHFDNSVLIHSSAASGARPTGTIISSPKGWYDAGDYNSYIVNSGISTYTLLAAYENFKSYYDTVNMVIPESGNALPDILDEIKWNLDWMLTMQDPNDGGVYHKKTCLGFDGYVMPAASNCTRYVVAKSTAATFDFAAVMAVAYRIYKPFDLTYANQCLAAAQSAYNWGIANPTVYFSNPGGVATGEYGDNNVTDEREWAATELYIATLNNTYYANSFKNATFYAVPAWPQVRTLGLMSLVYHRKNLTALGFADTTNMKNKLIGIANPYSNHWLSGSAYKVAMGAAGNGNFVWGSNGEAANIGMVLLSAYRISNDVNHYYAALSNMDYLLGRNATTYSFLGAFGTKTVMHPHHRPSEADGIANPVPGWLAGGPNTDAPGDCGSGYPSTTYKALCYQDAVCSYSTNEIAINWNAPFVFLASAIENLTPCGITALPINFFNFYGKKEGSKIKLTWQTEEISGIKEYTLYKSSDGKSFIPFKTVEAKNTLRNQEYTTFDENPSSKNYYRIKTTMLNGNSEWSNIIIIEENFSSILAYPNPASSEVTIQSAQDMQRIQLINLSGEILADYTLQETTKLKTIPITELKTGLYFISILTESTLTVEKLLVK